jgi:hypothetical protein
MEVRLGGIYSLKRIMRDSNADKEAVIDAVSTYVRENTKALRGPDGKRPRRPPAADIQASASVVKASTLFRRRMLT